MVCPGKSGEADGLQGGRVSPPSLGACGGSTDGVFRVKLTPLPANCVSVV